MAAGIASAPGVRATALLGPQLPLPAGSGAPSASTSLPAAASASGPRRLLLVPPPPLLLLLVLLAGRPTGGEWGHGGAHEWGRPALAPPLAAGGGGRLGGGGGGTRGGRL